MCYTTSRHNLSGLAPPLYITGPPTPPYPQKAAWSEMQEPGTKSVRTAMLSVNRRHVCTRARARSVTFYRCTYRPGHRQCRHHFRNRTAEHKVHSESGKPSLFHKPVMSCTFSDVRCLCLTGYVSNKVLLLARINLLIISRLQQTFHSRTSKAQFSNAWILIPKFVSNTILFVSLCMFCKYCVQINYVWHKYII